MSEQTAAPETGPAPPPARPVSRLARWLFEGPSTAIGGRQHHHT